ncbi:hypothetical protein [Limnoglobus roseus]|uniref:Uncharacterized protein n=1 Tax=Limnoglobus roseus TaxID=2598579 RepID=A0A5C1A968_9BACT|nr:hypothetical protein [Limnoglobus roseus]QEL13654.1 hypothetical protein PX52LOC_00512 [Limnoglobus roseus]
MRITRTMLPCLLSAIVAMTASAVPARGQVHDVVVGVTIACPYENAIEGSCWSGAYWALTKLDGVKSVDKAANGYNCTAQVYPKDAGLPDPQKWAAQFKATVDQTYTFRGVEVTASGTVASTDAGLVLTIPGVKDPVPLGPLKNKLQWNAKKKAARQPEPDERDAYDQLAAQLKADKGGEHKVKLTGPLLTSEKGYTLEVREFFPVAK